MVFITSLALVFWKLRLELRHRLVMVVILACVSKKFNCIGYLFAFSFAVIYIRYIYAGHNVWKIRVKHFTQFRIICNICITFLENDLFTSRWLFVKSGTTVFQKVLLSVTLEVLRLLKCCFFVVFKSFLQWFLWTW